MKFCVIVLILYIGTVSALPKNGTWNKSIYFIIYNSNVIIIWVDVSEMFVEISEKNFSCTLCKDIIADVESQIMDPSNMIEVRQFHTKIIKSSD